MLGSIIEDILDNLANKVNPKATFNKNSKPEEEKTITPSAKSARAKKKEKPEMIKIDKSRFSLDEELLKMLTSPKSAKSTKNEKFGSSVKIPIPEFQNTMNVGIFRNFGQTSTGGSIPQNPVFSETSLSQNLGQTSMGSSIPQNASLTRNPVFSETSLSQSYSFPRDLGQYLGQNLGQNLGQTSMGSSIPQNLNQNSLGISFLGNSGLNTQDVSGIPIPQNFDQTSMGRTSFSGSSSSQNFGQTSMGRTSFSGIPQNLNQNSMRISFLGNSDVSAIPIPKNKSFSGSSSSQNFGQTSIESPEIFTRTDTGIPQPSSSVTRYNVISKPPNANLKPILKQNRATFFGSIGNEDYIQNKISLPTDIQTNVFPIQGKIRRPEQTKSGSESAYASATNSKIQILTGIDIKKLSDKRAKNDKGVYSLEEIQEFCRLLQIKYTNKKKSDLISEIKTMMKRYGLISKQT